MVRPQGEPNGGSTSDAQQYANDVEARAGEMFFAEFLLTVEEVLEGGGKPAESEAQSGPGEADYEVHCGRLCGARRLVSIGWNPRTFCIPAKAFQIEDELLELWRRHRGVRIGTKGGEPTLGEFTDRRVYCASDPRGGSPDERGDCPAQVFEGHFTLEYRYPS